MSQEQLPEFIQQERALRQRLGLELMQSIAAMQQQDDGKQMADGDGGGEWRPFLGPQGGEGWENVVTGERRYQKEKPTDIADLPEEIEPSSIPGYEQRGDQHIAEGLDDDGEWKKDEISAGVPPSMNDDDNVRRYDIDNERYKSFRSARFGMDLDKNEYIEFDRDELVDIDIAARERVNDMITEAANTFDPEQMFAKFDEVNETISTMVHPDVDWDASFDEDTFTRLDEPVMTEVAEFAHKFYNAILDAEEQGLLTDVTRIIGTNDPQFNQGVGGWYNPASGVMFVNVITANKQLIRERYSKNASSSPEGIGTFWHELAHARHYTNKFTEIDAPRQPLLEYMLEFGLTESRLTLDEKDFAREHLSEYASTSHMEFIAEAVKAAKTDALDLTDEQMRFVLDVFERLDGPTELLR